MNTVALPDPSETMTEEFRESLDLLLHIDRDAVEAAIEDAEDAAYSRDWSELARSDEYVALPPPVELLKGRIRTVDELSKALAAVEARWILDIIMAVSDYLDEN